VIRAGAEELCLIQSFGAVCRGVAPAALISINPAGSAAALQRSAATVAPALARGRSLGFAQ